MATVFVSGTLPGASPARLAELHHVVQDEAGIRSAAFEACRDSVEGIVALLTDRIDGTLLDSAPRLKIVANVAVGVDNVDLAACAARVVVVTNTPDVLTEATADMAFGLLIAAARRIAEGDRLVRSGGFTGWTPTFMLGTRVHGMTLGIVGMGRIGQALARRARGFGMHVLYNQRTRLPEPLERALGATYTQSLDEMLAWADAVSIHCPLTPETRHLFSRERLGRMKEGSILVNTARGPIVDEAALADVLEHGPLSAAGLDVFEEEPTVHPALLARPNAVLAPHIGSADRVTREAMAATAIANVLRVLGGEPALTPVAPRR
ncbi:D-3-phosphoglycerate dehydrogenase [Labilithrix luteola]|uniref:D-3-phosphoglycerate dehydrogenase n=1 Tax=Labilithrix luteola TaxID=1391654 RepID=A0A0K1QA59_9BACT|nr:D-glycerate dehydrogenase [Labilithrix luteola]AKV02557.1 D-3-phosphoglycerate dehydrogenase [Labilithrix luteola]